MIAAGLCATSLSLGSHVASGSDSYGYVSQAQLWSQGSLIQPEPLVRLAAWPNAAATLAPLGYRPAQRAFANVPTYAPGLPILMALARTVGGPCAVYVVVPITAALLVWFTYLLALRVSDPLVALGAAVWMASSPTLFFMMMWPLSDVPVSACWLLALLIAASSTTWKGALATGAVSGLAILIRPNLVPLAIVPAGLVLFRMATLDRSSWRRAALAIAAGLLPFAAGVAVLNASLYGSPLESGYGSLSWLFRIERVRRNFVLQTGWLVESQGWYLLAVLLGGALQLRRGFGNVLTWGLAFAALVWCAYLPYHSFDAWWYLRFLLPAFPIVFIVAVDGVASVSGWFGPTVRVVVTSLFVVSAAAHGVVFARGKGIVGLGEGEQRAIETASFVAQSLPEKAVLVSGQHSGSIRYLLRSNDSAFRPAGLGLARSDRGHVERVGLSPVCRPRRLGRADFCPAVSRSVHARADRRGADRSTRQTNEREGVRPSTIVFGSPGCRSTDPPYSCRRVPRTTTPLTPPGSAVFSPLV